MVDTGAAVSLIDSSTWSRIKGQSTLKPWVNSGLVGVNGVPLRVKGTATLQLAISGYQYPIEVIIADLRTEAILGIDFLEANQCAIDLSRGLMSLNGNCKPITLTRAGPKLDLPDNVSVVLSNSVYIPGSSEMEVSAVLQGPTEPGTLIVERCVLPHKPSILVATSIVDFQRSGDSPVVPIRMLNLSPDSITIHKDTKVAIAHSVEEDSVLVAGVSKDSSLFEPHLSDTKRQLLWQAVESAGDELTQQEQEQLYVVLSQYGDVFADNSGDLGKTDEIQHTIETGDSPPVRQPARRIPVAQQEEVRKLLREMQENNVIQPSRSPWAAPVVLVKKKDGSTRFCVDYRKLNVVTRKDAYPLPRIDDTLQSLAGSKWFSTIDLLSGYWQVGIAEKDKAKTAFITQEGLFEFNVMPFGLCNAPATFQRLMNLTLSGMLWSECLVYLDDIIIFGRTFKEHLEHLASVLGRLREVGLKAKLTV